MSRGINKVILIGYLGQNPEFVQSGGVKTTRLSLATTETWKDKTTRERQEQTEWHRIVFFGRLAEVAAEYLKKGSQVYVEGRLQTNKWKDKQGVERTTTQIIANALQMLDPKGAAQTTEPKPLQDDDDIEF